MIEVKKEGILLMKTGHEFENDGVLNPAAMQEGNTVHIFYRAVRKGNYSTIGYCKLDGPMNVKQRYDKPILVPDQDSESHGVEDPRIVKIEDTYYLTYTAYDGLNALGALATSKDLLNFEKKGFVVPQIGFEEFQKLAETVGHLNEKYQRYSAHNTIVDDTDRKALLWDKNVIFFPRRINGKLYFLHRIRPDIQIAGINSLEDLTREYWKKYFVNLEENIVLTPKYKHEVSYIGGGCPPIETKYGWLLIYHGVHDTPQGYVYSACAALLNLENPHKEVSRLPYALFKPEYDWELKGEVNNVVFPTGTSLFGDTLYIYYGAADERIACASLSLSALLEELNKYL